MTVHQIKARLDRETEIMDWRLHDLRRTLRRLGGTTRAP
jgi:hypothetical protein